MKFYTFCILFILINCGVVNSFNFWSYLNEDKQKEKIIIENGHGLLVTYENKNDCFKEASLTIRNKCGELDKLDNEKMEYAIQLTICQLEKADFDVPDACKSKISSDYFRQCLSALKSYNQFWTTYMTFYSEAVQMCYSSRYSIEIDLLEQFGKNMTDTYNDIISGIKNLMSSLRNEEKERIPRITNSLDGLVNEIRIIKSKSEFIMNEILIVEKKFKEFQNSIQEVFSQITTKADESLKHVVPYVKSIFEELSIYKENIITSVNDKLDVAQILLNSNLEKINSVNQKLISVEEMASKSVLEHLNLQENIEETKNVINDLLVSSRDEIMQFSSYSVNEFKKVNESIDTITSVFSIINKFAGFIKKWFIVLPPIFTSLFGFNSFIIGEVSSLLFMLYDYENSLFYGYNLYTHFVTMIIGSIFSKYALSMFNNFTRINKYILLIFFVIKFIVIACIKLYY